MWDCTLPIVVVLVDDGDSSRVQVDPEKVRPDIDAALQPVALLYLSQLTVHRIHIHGTCYLESF